MASRRQNDQSWVPKPGTVLDDRYRLDEMVDQGGMGVIMRGEHLRMKRDVAVKLLKPDIATEAGYRARFQREVDLAAKIEHPNIVRCYDFGETETGLLYLVMELLDGLSLKEVLTEEGRMSTRRVARLMLPVLDGMSTAHLQDVVHRDLKPSNIYIEHDHRGNEVVKVLDFGLAKGLSSDHVRLTRTGAVCGTASYVPPESLVLQHVGKQGDIYAVGLIMLELLLGRQVCTARAMAQTFLQHLVVPARIPRRVWETDLGQLIAKALQKHPDDRYQSAEEMFQALLEVIDDLPDFELSPSELPPLPSDDLDDRLLSQLGNGKYATIDALHEMPAPEPWDLHRDMPDDGETQRGLVLDLDRMADLLATVQDEPEFDLSSTIDENYKGPSPTTADYPQKQQWKQDAPDMQASETERDPVQAAAEPVEMKKQEKPDELAGPAAEPKWQSSALIFGALALVLAILLVLILS